VSGNVALASARFVKGTCPGPGTVEAELQGTNAALMRSIDSRPGMGVLKLHIDGTDYTVHDIQVTKMAKSSRVVIRIDYMTCEKSQSTQPPVMKATMARPTCNAKIIGVNPTGPADLCVVRSTINGKNDATVWLIKSDATQALAPQVMLLSAKGTKTPLLTIEAKGQKWTFTNVLFSSVKTLPDNGLEFSINFDSMTGDPAAFANIGS
jgi:hypothetical protein